MRAAMRGVIVCAWALGGLTVGGLTVGCDGGARDEARRGSETTPARVELGPEAAQLYQRTLVRDPAPSCAELTAGLARPTDALLEVAERVVAPPSSGMRAASCLVHEHAAELEPQLTRWVQDQETMGFGLLVLGQLDTLENTLAERLARAALAGDFAEEARPRIARSVRHAHLLGELADPGSVAPR